VPTFIFADLAGFTALTETHGDEDASRLVEQFVALVRRLLPAGAKLVKTVGDAAMIVVDDEASGVAFARALMAATEELPGRPALRVGIHSGDAVEREGDYWGLAVNVAARVASLAQPSEILLTETVRRRIGEQAGAEAQFAPRGEHRLKNVSEPVVLFALTSDDAGLRTDPVCKMRVRESEIAGSLVHEGATYYFCSLRCVRSFADRPEAYAAGRA